MKEQIDKLVELAKEYTRVHKLSGGKTGEWEIVRGQLFTNDYIGVYVGKNDYWEVCFGELKVACEVIKMPIDSTADTLRIIHDDAKDYLPTINLHALEHRRKERVDKRIAELKQELAELEEA